MKRFFSFLIFAGLFVSSCSLLKKTPPPPPAAAKAGGVPADRNKAYTDQYQAAAMLNMQRSGVPASITLSQGILESGAGTSELSVNANNHFGVKCGNNWTGKTYMKKDDDRDEKGNLKESCFRKYEKVEDSYMDHAQFLRDPKKEQRYGFLFKLDPTDYKGWAKGLQSSGYSTSNTYADKLIDIIERYHLYEYDVPGSNTASAVPEAAAVASATGADVPLQTATNRVGKINNVKVVAAREGESISDIAKAYRLSPDKVAEYNDRGYTPIQKLKANTRVFINAKKDKWSGSTATEHVVKPNQTMFDISQLYGVKLNKLLERNVLSRGQEPAEGQRILLNSKRAANDPVQLRDENAVTTSDNMQGNAPYTAPHAESLTPDDNGLLDEISGGEANAAPSAPATTVPAATVAPPPPSAVSAPPPTFATPPQTTAAPSQPTGAPVPAVTGNTTYPPVSTSPAPEIQPELTKPPVAAPGTHTVVKGDTLTNIAKRYNISVAKLKELNNMTDGNIKIGQVLKVK